MKKDSISRCSKRHVGMKNYELITRPRLGYRTELVACPVEVCSACEGRPTPAGAGYGVTVFVPPAYAGGTKTGGPTGIRTQNQRIMLTTSAFAALASARCVVWTMPSP